MKKLLAVSLLILMSSALSGCIIDPGHHRHHGGDDRYNQGSHNDHRNHDSHGGHHSHHR